MGSVLFSPVFSPSPWLLLLLKQQLTQTLLSSTRCLFTTLLPLLWFLPSSCDGPVSQLLAWTQLALVAGLMWWFLQEEKGGQLRLKLKLKLRLRLLLMLPQKPKLRLKQLLHLLPSTPCLWLLTTLMVLCPQWPCAAPATLLSTMLVLLTTPGCTPSMWYLLVASAGMLMLKLMPTLTTQL